MLYGTVCFGRVFRCKQTDELLQRVCLARHTRAKLLGNLSLCRTATPPRRCKCAKWHIQAHLELRSSTAALGNDMYAEAVLFCRDEVAFLRYVGQTNAKIARWQRVTQALSWFLAVTKTLVIAFTSGHVRCAVTGTFAKCGQRTGSDDNHHRHHSHSCFRSRTFSVSAACLLVAWVVDMLQTVLSTMVVLALNEASTSETLLHTYTGCSVICGVQR